MIFSSFGSHFITICEQNLQNDVPRENHGLWFSSRCSPNPPVVIDGVFHRGPTLCNVRLNVR